MEIIKTTIPLSPELINIYTKNNKENNQNILFDFNIQQSELSNKHIIGYLSHLKIDFNVYNFTKDFLYEYMTSNFYLGKSNLIEEHLIYLSQHSNELTQEQFKFINSFPLLLIHSIYPKNKHIDNIINNTNYIKNKNPLIGVNISHFINYSNELLLSLIGDKIYNFKEQYYYNYYFDNHLYDNKKLIQLFIENNKNLLNIGVEYFINK